MIISFRLAVPFVCALIGLVGLSGAVALADDSPPPAPHVPGTSADGSSGGASGSAGAASATPSLPAGASTAAGEGGSAGASRSTDTSAAGGSSALQGNVKGQTVTARTSTKDIGEFNHHLKQALNCLINEMQRQDVVSTAPGDIIGGNIVLPTLPNPSGLVALGDTLPPRKKWVDFWMSHLQVIVPEVRAEIIATILPNDAKGDLPTLWKSYREQFNDIERGYSKLLADTVGPNYNSNLIINEAVDLYKKVEAFDKTRKDVWKTVKELDKKQ